MITQDWLIREAVPLAMPLQIVLFWPIPRVVWQKDSSSFKVREALSRYPFLCEFFSVYKYTIIIIQRPEATIKLPMGVLR